MPIAAPVYGVVRLADKNKKDVETPLVGFGLADHAVNGRGYKFSAQASNHAVSTSGVNSMPSTCVIFIFTGIFPVENREFDLRLRRVE